MAIEPNGRRKAPENWHHQSKGSLSLQGASFAVPANFFFFCSSTGFRDLFFSSRAQGLERAGELLAGGAGGPRHRRRHPRRSSHGRQKLVRSACGRRDHETWGALAGLVGGSTHPPTARKNPFGAEELIGPKIGAAENTGRAGRGRGEPPPPASHDFGCSRTALGQRLVNHMPNWVRFTSTFDALPNCVKPNVKVVQLLRLCTCVQDNVNVVFMRLDEVNVVHLWTSEK